MRAPVILITATVLAMVLGFALRFHGVTLSTEAPAAARAAE